MRAVIQRVRSASVTADGVDAGQIGEGLLVLLGIDQRDQMADAEWTAQKTAQLRIFDDADGLMNRSITETGGGLLIVSQFTLIASTKKGTRPSFHRAARPDQAVPLYEAFISHCRSRIQGEIATGRFGADMRVTLVNDGPVTLVLDSHLRE